MASTTITKNDWETIYEGWSQPPGKTEQERCERAVNSIKDAINKDSALSSRNMSTFAQGSYRNRTNVRKDSDVDVCVLCHDVIMLDYSNGLTFEDIGLTAATYKFAAYKNEVGTALVNKFGYENVERGNKAFDINENTYRVDADAAPCFRYRHYYMIEHAIHYHEGTALIADNDGQRYTNYPEQQYDNGVAKNTQTARRYKKLVRILKKLRYTMEDSNIDSAKEIPSYLVECLVWNAPNDLFIRDNLTECVDGIIAFLWDGTKDQESCEKWTEENNIKFLFHPSQPWSHTGCHKFLEDAWSYTRPK